MLTTQQNLLLKLAYSNVIESTSDSDEFELKNQDKLEDLVNQMTIKKKNNFKSIYSLGAVNRILKVYT